MPATNVGQRSQAWRLREGRKALEIVAVGDYRYTVRFEDGLEADIDFGAMVMLYTNDEREPELAADARERGEVPA